MCSHIFFKFVLYLYVAPATLSKEWCFAPCYGCALVPIPLGKEIFSGNFGTYLRPVRTQHRKEFGKLGSVVNLYVATHLTMQVFQKTRSRGQYLDAWNTQVQTDDVTEVNELPKRGHILVLYYSSWKFAVIILPIDSLYKVSFNMI